MTDHREIMVKPRREYETTMLDVANCSRQEIDVPMIGTEAETPGLGHDPATWPAHIHEAIRKVLTDWRDRHPGAMPRAISAGIRGKSFVFILHFDTAAQVEAAQQAAGAVG